MNRLLRSALVLAWLVTTPAAMVAQVRPPAAPPPVYHPAPPVYHPAPITRPAPPVTRAGPPVMHHPEMPKNPGGFSLQNDVNVSSRPHAPPARPIPRPKPPHIPYPSGPHHHWPGPVIGNPHNWHGWGWNNGVIWYPVPVYWGGGFWGPWYRGAPGLLLYGSIVDYQNHAIYPSYQIQTTSPGEQLLEDFGLAQTPCGPPNLVVIWGPGNSVICAYPNQLVSAGSYELDPATLTLKSLRAPNQ